MVAVTRYATRLDQEVTKKRHRTPTEAVTRFTTRLDRTHQKEVLYLYGSSGEVYH